MFESFDHQADAPSGRRWLASAGTSLTIYAVIGGALLLVARNTVAARRAPPEIDVSFHAAPEPPQPAPAEPSPPPAKPAAAAPAPAAKPKAQAASGSKRKGAQRLRQLSAVPDDRPDEAAPDGTAIEVDPDAFAGEPGGMAPGPAVAETPAPPQQVADTPPADPVRDFIDLPDRAIAAAPQQANRPPEYPDEARRKGIEAMVVLRVVISETGEVTEVTVVRGEEPFVTAALTAVRAWRYEPARLDGQAVAAARLIKIPFRIKG